MGVNKMAQSKQTELTKNVFTKQDNIIRITTRDSIDDNERRLLHYYISFVQNHPDLIFVFTQEGHLLTNNFDKMNKHLGYRAKDNIDYKQIIPPDQYETIVSAFKRALKGQSSSLPFDILNYNKNYQHFIATIIPIESINNHVEAISFIIKDITEERRLDLANKLKMKHLDRAQKIANVGSWEYDLKQNKFTCTKALYQLIGITPSQILTEEIILPLIDYYDRESFITFLKKSLYNESPQTTQIRFYHGETKQLCFMKITVVIEKENDEPIKLIGVVQDVTNEMKMKRQLEHYAKHDMITNLPNYYSLHEKLDSLMGNLKIERFAILYLNLDNFYWIVNYLGHEMGDKVLKKMAVRLKSLCPVNGFLAKEKGDSFIFIIENYENEKALIEHVNKIMKSVSQKLVIDDYEFNITTSIGISLYPKHATEKLKLFEHAYSALHYAKKLGKNNYQIYSYQQDLNAHKRYTLEKDLRQAIDHNELLIYYQPQVNPNTNTLIGAEALLRWNNPTWGLLQPDDFMSIAEDKHLLNKIYDWQIRHILKQFHDWKEAKIPLYPISINVSPVQLLQLDMVETLSELLEEYDISPKYIILEITEGSPLQQNEYFISTIRKLKNLGIRIAIDDFGTGFSTFQYLQTFDFDIIKIDKEFIKNLTSNNTKEAAIVSSFLHLASSLDIEVVAEGVETYEQLQFLHQKQCHAIQGKIFSKPLTEDEFRKLMIRRVITPVVTKSQQEGQNDRKFYRFEFTFPISGKMYITEIAEKQTNIGYANILITNVSIGGIRIISNFKIPVVSELKLKFEFNIMGKVFHLNGSLVYQEEERNGLYSYGVSFNIPEVEQDKLAKVINHMTILRKINEQIPNTEFVTEEPSVYLRKRYK